MYIQSSDRNLVVVNVHFEPDLTLRDVRERQRLITPYWPLYPEAVGVITGDVNICEPVEGRFNVWNQIFTDGDAGRPLFSVPFSLMSSKSLSLTLQGEIQEPTVQYAHCPGLTEHLSISLWLKHATSTAILMYLRILENGPYRVTIQPYVSLFKNRQVGATKAIAFRVGCSNIPSSALF